MKQDLIIHLNNKVVKGLTLEQFKEQMKHHESDLDLQAEYKKLHPEPVKEAKK